MKILLVNDTENDYHFGCTGTSRAVKKYLSQKGELQAKSYTVIDSWTMNPTPKTISGYRHVHKSPTNRLFSFSPAHSVFCHVP